MKKSLFVLAAVLTFIGTGSTAFAYELSAPVNAEAPFALGAGEVDFSQPSYVAGTITVASTNGGAWVTAGDVAHESTGYGFYVDGNRLFGVSNTGSFSFTIPLGYIRAGQEVNVRADYTPNKGIVFNTSWAASDWAQYSRGIIQGTLPNGAIRGLGALFGSAVNTDFVLGSWSYIQ